MLIIPAIDIIRGRVVRLQMGDFREVKSYGLSPLEFAKKWETQGAALIHVVDLDGAKAGEPKNLDVVKQVIVGVNVDIEVGGGIRLASTVNSYLDAGAERVVLGTSVIEDPSFLTAGEVSERVRRIAVSIDIRRMESKEIMTSSTSGWQKSGDRLVDIPSFVQGVTRAGVRHINFSDISRDGLMQGVDTAKIGLFLNVARKAAPGDTAFTYAGGISSLDDIRILASLGKDGPDAAIVGRALYEEKFTLREAIAAAC